MAGEIIVSTINGAGFDGGNVIINPEFTVNQRAAASRTTTSSAYNYDRWYYDGTNLLQGVEGNNLRAGTYVISWEGSSTAAYSLNDAAASGQGSESYASVSNGGTITIASVGSDNLWLKFTSDLTNLTKVKLTPGTQASAFVPRPYGTELALCQRYYELGFSSFYIGVTNTYQYSVPVFYKVVKRATPTVAGVNNANLGFPTTFTVSDSNTNGFMQYRIANATRADGSFSINWTASIEL